MLIRESYKSDKNGITALHKKAFGPDEGVVVAKLVIDILNDKTAQPTYSYIAEKDGEIAAHVLFSKAVLGELNIQNLAPLAVLPKYQKAGIGTELTQEALKKLKEQGVDLLFVLGHPDYYPRFGFRPAGELGLDAPYPIPEKNSDAWMVLELSEGILGTVRGTVACCDALDDPAMWRE